MLFVVTADTWQTSPVSLFAALDGHGIRYVADMVAAVLGDHVARTPEKSGLLAPGERKEVEAEAVGSSLTRRSCKVHESGSVSSPCFFSPLVAALFIVSGSERESHQVDHYLEMQMMCLFLSSPV